jgi:hypothetical protein
VRSGPQSPSLTRYWRAPAGAISGGRVRDSALGFPIKTAKKDIRHDAGGALATPFALS